ncbi:MAG: molecular chaperone DjiA [Pseudomonadota bacterium]
MSIWTQLGEFLSEIANDAFAGVVEAVRTVFEGDPETRRQVGFSVAMIALSAKMAKADGVVTSEEVRAFQQIFDIPDKEFNNVSRLYNLAKQDVAGFQSYARKVKNLFPEEKDILEDVMDGLFHIAKADGLYHESEIAFMDHIAEIFGIEGREYERIRLRHMEPEDGNPYVLLEADPQWDDDRMKKHYRKLVSENHPDRMIARGVPPEFIAISNDRVAQINKAWDRVKLERGL